MGKVDINVRKNRRKSTDPLYPVMNSNVMTYLVYYTQSRDSPRHCSLDLLSSCRKWAALLCRSVPPALWPGSHWLKGSSHEPKQASPALNIACQILFPSLPTLLSNFWKKIYLHYLDVQSFLVFISTFAVHSV